MKSKLKYFLDNLFYLTEIPCSVWDAEKCNCSWNVSHETQYIEFSDLQNSIEILDVISKQETPFVFSEDNQYFYGVSECAPKMIAILGPIVITEPSHKEKNNFREKHHVSKSAIDMKFYVKSINYLICTLGLIYHYYTGENITLQKVLRYNQEDKIMEEIEYERMSHSLENTEFAKESYAYQYTQKIKQLVIQGDFDAMLRETNSFQYDHMGEFTTSSYKRFEYMAVTYASILTQAAVEGGVPSPAAYDLSDIYLLRIEKCQTIEDIQRIMMTMAQDFTLRVKAYKGRHLESASIERCKDYVIRHINKPISLEDIAEYVHWNKYYLSKVFYRKEGMHLHEFIHRERVKAASNMLKFSDVPLTDIASYFCFGSQSHFGEVFKKYQGMTPKQYRDQNKVTNYLPIQRRQ